MHTHVFITHAATAASLGKGGAADGPYGGSRERPLSDRERDRFEDMLRNLTVFGFMSVSTLILKNYSNINK